MYGLGSETAVMHLGVVAIVSYAIMKILNVRTARILVFIWAMGYMSGTYVL